MPLTTALARPWPRMSDPYLYIPLLSTYTYTLFCAKEMAKQEKGKAHKHSVFAQRRRRLRNFQHNIRAADAEWGDDDDGGTYIYIYKHRLKRMCACRWGAISWLYNMRRVFLSP